MYIKVRKILLIFILAFFLLVFFVTVGYVAFDPMQIGAGAKSVSMGRAFSSEQDPFSLFQNPAGTANLKDYSFSSMLTSFDDASHTMLGVTTPTPIGTVGFGTTGYTIGGITNTTRTNNRVTSTGTTFDYSDRLYLLSLGKVFNDKFRYGATLKYFDKKFGLSNQSQGSGMDIDIGAQYDINPNITTSFVVKNALPSSMGGKVNWKSGYSEGLGHSMNAGIMYKNQQGTEMALEVETAYNKPAVLHAGVDWKMFGPLNLRAGMDQQAVSLAEIRTYPTAGIGLKVRDVNFDYAYRIDPVLDSNSMHYFSLNISLPKPAGKTITKTQPESPLTTPAKVSTPKLETNLETKTVVAPVIPPTPKKVEPIKVAAVKEKVIIKKTIPKTPVKRMITKTVSLKTTIPQIIKVKVTTEPPKETLAEKTQWEKLLETIKGRKLELLIYLIALLITLFVARIIIKKFF